MFRTRGVGSHERKVDLGLLGAGKLDLGFFRRLFQALEGHPVLLEVDPLVFLELVYQPIDDALVEVVAAQVGVAVRCFDVERPLADLEDRDVERPATKVVYGDHLLVRLVQPVGERGGRRLVDDAKNVQPRDLSGGLRRLPLRVVEVCGHSYDRLGHLVAQVCFRIGLQLLQNHRAELGRRVGLVAHPDARVAVGCGVDLVGQDLEVTLHFGVVEAAAHQALDREHGVIRVRHALTLRHLPDEPLAVLRDRDDGRRRPAALGVGHHDGLAAFHYPDAAICCSKVYSNCSRHRYHSSRGLRASASSLKLRHAESRSDFARCHFASLDRPSGPVRSSGCNVAPSTTFVGLGVSSSKRACDWSSRFKVERKMTSDSLMLISLRFPFFLLPFSFFLP